MMPAPAAATVQAPSRYDPTTIMLHWLTAALVGWQWLGGQTIDWLPRGTFREGLWSLHIVLGACLALVLLARLAWRLTRGRRLPAEPGLLGLAARAVHGLLYLTLAVVLGAGLFWVWVRGSDIFGVLKVPEFDPGNRALRGLVGEWHETAANLLIILAGLHAAAALLHHYLLHDATLARMGLGRLRAP